MTAKKNIPIKDVDTKQSVINYEDNLGIRYNEGKPRYDLIPPEFIEALAIHLGNGSLKYSERNWEIGLSWGDCFRAMMSHAWKWMRGERYDIDPKMPGYQAPHLIAVAWNAMALYTYEQRKIGKDDRHIV